MAHSRFTSAQLRGGTIDVAGPFELSAAEAEDDRAAHGARRADPGPVRTPTGTPSPKDGVDGGDWVVEAEIAGAFTPGKPAQGFGFVSLVDEGENGDSPLHETFQWSEPVMVTKAV